MKRHEALAPLSREHHESLILAQLLKKNASVYKGLPDLAVDKVKYAVQLFKKSIQKHFEQEEAMLEQVSGCNMETDKLAQEIKTEHRQLAALFQLLEAGTDIENNMNTLGVALENHIRKEERILFPLLQLHCSEEQLQQISKLLH
jgi:hemerythrin-like domain-containing protein